MFATLSDEALMERIDSMAQSCLRIMEMPEEVRQKPADKGTSPEQFGTIQAGLVLAAWEEARKRGLVDEDL